MKQQLWFLALGLLGVLGCTQEVRTTREYDPVTTQISQQWQGIAVTAAIAGLALCIVAWAIAWAVVEVKRGRK